MTIVVVDYDLWYNINTVPLMRYKQELRLHVYCATMLELVFRIGSRIILALIFTVFFSLNFLHCKPPTDDVDKICLNEVGRNATFLFS